ncbi:hypothetical protein AYY17_03100 [Morganella psychrotolerans]|uniref:Uncharacterized protein n=1 Tax=Morganella psychrotolerans TaxID=368603 RepID=A0A1B8HQD3_9GAMM|nr:hypothetical protein AYY17_03100 [Morganella psychrotolerans]
MGERMKHFKIDAKGCGESAVVTVEYGRLLAEAKRVGALRKIAITGRGNVRQIKTIAKIFMRALN